MGPKMRMTHVASVQELSPHMKRIILTGDALADFPDDKKGAHVKAIFPNPQSSNNTPKLGMYIGFKKWMRSYTIRDFDKQRGHLTIDFAVNDHKGLASNWAAKAKPGDLLGIAGPGEVKHPDMSADSHLFIGDITALPAIAATLEQLPENAVGEAWIQVPDEQDKQAFRVPKNINLNWLVTPNKFTDKFLHALQSHTTHLTKTAIFIAAEASMVRQLKNYINEHCEYDAKLMYTSAYWNQKR
jgi:NADPH-dependent ferric siderophore reductase